MVEKEAGSNTVNVGNATGKIGFYAATPVALQTGITASANALTLHTALVNLGLITA